MTSKCLLITLDWLTFLCGQLIGPILMTHFIPMYFYIYICAMWDEFFNSTHIMMCVGWIVVFFRMFLFWMYVWLLFLVCFTSHTFSYSHGICLCIGSYSIFIHKQYTHTIFWFKSRKRVRLFFVRSRSFLLLYSLFFRYDRSLLCTYSLLLKKPLVVPWVNEWVCTRAPLSSVCDVVIEP